MTLGELIDSVGDNPLPALGYFLAIPFTALLAGWLGRGEGEQTPWKYLYAVLVYAVCIPGIFAVALSVYQFMFGRRDILNADVLAQVLPIGSMLLTLGIIGRNVSFSAIPGFGRLSGLMMMIGAIFVLMYFLDRLHIVAFVRLPVEVLLVVVVGALLLLRFAFGRLMA
ncbi:MAG: hypothetical protein ACOYNO_15145, partial [Saprospiraceae bacterium]